MTYSGHADSKMMFYPTQEFETHRLLGLLGRIEIDWLKKNYLKEYYTKEGIYQELAMKALDNNVRIENVYYDYWLNTNQYDMIKKNCEFRTRIRNIEF